MKKICLYFIILLIFCFPLVSAQGLADAWVCPSGDCGQGSSGFNSIQLAINAVSNGGIVHIEAGTYFESITIQSSVTLKGTGADYVIVQGSPSVDCITINSSSVTIDGIRFIGGRNGLSGEIANSSIRHCVFENYSADGVHLVNSDFNLVEGNTINGVGAVSTGSGVLLEGSQNNSIAGNTVRDNAFNMFISADAGRTSQRNTIHGNTLLDPRYWSVEVRTAAVTTKLNFNVFKTAETDDRYVRNAAIGTLNAQFNWFGGENPPQPTDFSGDIDHSNHYATNMTIFMFPTIQYMKPGDELDILVLGLVPVGTQIRGTTMTVSWNGSVTSLQGSPTQGSLYTQRLVNPQNEFFQFNPLTPTNSVTIDQSLMGGTTGAGNMTGIPYVGVLYILKFQGITTGLSTLALSNVLVRDPNNNPVAPVIVAPTQVYVDGQPPTISNLVIDNTTLNTDENGDTFDDFVKNSDNLTITATVMDNNPISAAGFFADLSGFYGGSGHTAVPPSSYASNVATWIVSGANCSPVNGALNLTLSVSDTAGNSATQEKAIASDNIVPTKILNFAATPGHKKVTLQWSDPSSNDAHYKGAMIRFNRWNDYPVFGAAPPAYPATVTSGTEAFSAVAGTNTIHSFVEPDRDVYYYSAFAADWAGNYSTTDAQSQDRSTNYHLGDLGSSTGEQLPGSGYDGFVNFDDLIWFSNLYLLSGPPYPAARECDFGPTVATKTYGAGSSHAIPAPDGQVNFEDLIIFSFNYLSVAPKISSPPNSESTNELALSLVPSTVSTSSSTSIVEVRVHLANNGSQIKGCSVSLRFDPTRVRYVGGNAGDVFGALGQGLYFIRPDEHSVQVDAAVLGTDRSVDFSGDIAVLRFATTSRGEESIAIDRAVLRDATNGNLSAELNSAAKELPPSFRLNQNFPNPFNPSTTISFELPKASDVTIEVFTTLGEVMTTMVNRRMEAGVHSLVWDGVDQHGVNVATGMYLVRMKADNFTAIKKIVLLR